MTGKIEMGQGARTQLTQAAAEELRVSPEQIQMVMGDTTLTPDDGITAGSRTTPSTVPAVRQAAAAARELLVRTAAQKWGVEAAALNIQNGRITHPPTGRSMSYADLAQSGEADKILQQRLPAEVQVTPVSQWRVMGQSLPRVNRQALVTGAHQYPSDMRRPGMLYGKVLRPPSYGARLVSVDIAPARAMEGVVAVHDGSFVGVAAPTSWQAEQALKAIENTARWDTAPHPSSREVYDYLRQRAQGGVPPNPFANELAQAARRHKATYHVAYVQHAPMETRTALAEWQDGKLTVWTGTQAPFGYHGDLARTFRLPTENVRVIVPDFGGGFGGKHTAEAAIEAARLAQAAGKPVLVHWTREEEFTWAYFRPAAVIDIEASLNEEGRLTSWYFLNINSGAAAVDTPYRAGNARSRFLNSNSPLRQGSYRTLAATANNFAREAFMDELAALAGRDPLEFRLAHLENERIRNVLQEAARRFNWQERYRQKIPNCGVGLACGTEKNSVVAACVEIEIDTVRQTIVVKRLCEVFECGAIINPDNLMAQVQSCILMGLGPALREEMQFLNGKMRNAAFSKYPVPRFADVPEMDIHLLNRPDLPSAGGGETPIIAIAPAIANAVYHATGRRVRAMPIRLAEAQAM
ncbi:molybdopterin-dependent oxidoreductase [Fontisphaera persica]|uniref:xanthine dehydrogenase family protein molybdopterin-binding subunit n=1 Tax=Fontisphaera persica TaxID=2974023 RepID=UPI0024C05115|nr:molybdopterin cofactor-binding domain-containing protein [Fontisphaera persica]WCJ60407.1 molybdopterin-dependent oxidoreductase [Fontisphaera persica]